MQIPKWLRCYLENAELKDIEQALKNAEDKTSGEIVPMVVRSCTPQGHVPVILLLLGLVLILLMEVLRPQPLWALGLITIVVTISIPFLARVTWIQHLLSHSRDQQLMVQARALLEFYQNDLHKTADATGVLIFLSLMEKRAVILADKGIASRIETDKWQQVINTLLAHAKQRELKGALCEAISEVGNILARHFPSTRSPLNELKNQLLIKE